MGSGIYGGITVGGGNVVHAGVGLVTAPYHVVVAVSSAAGTLSTEYGRAQFVRNLELMLLLVAKFRDDDCFRKKVLATLGENAKAYFTDADKLSELFANIGVAAATAGLGASGEAAQLASKLGEVIEFLRAEAIASGDTKVLKVLSEAVPETRKLTEAEKQLYEIELDTPTIAAVLPKIL